MKSRDKVINLVYISMFTALITVCGWICIPSAVPFTLQTLAVFLCVMLLETKRSLAAVITYILLGAVGCPVFSGFRGGIGTLLGPTGGYIIGFILICIISGSLIKRFGDKRGAKFLSMLAGLICCYAFGTAWFVLISLGGGEAIGIWAAFASCVLPFIIPDIIKICIAIVIYRRIYPYIKTISENKG